MKKFTIFKTSSQAQRRSKAEEITSGSLSLFSETRIPVAGDYLDLGEGLGLHEVDWVIFDMDNGEVIIGATKKEWKDYVKQEKGNNSKVQHEGMQDTP